MIDGIRRKFAQSIAKDPWNTEQELESEVDERELVESSDLPTDAAFTLTAAQIAPPSTTNDVDSGEFCKNIVKTAIDNGGRWGDHQIPIPWLRMILAGLEWRRIDPEMMWYGFEASGSDQLLPEIPSYQDLFPSEPAFPAGPGPR